MVEVNKNQTYKTKICDITEKTAVHINAINIHCAVRLLFESVHYL